MKEENSLQKLSISDLLKRDEISKEEFDSLSDTEQNKFLKIVNSNFDKTTGVEKDKLVKRLENIMSKDTKNALWEQNHNKIISHVHNELVNNRRLLSTLELEKLTGLSRQTITKHLKEFKENEIYKSHRSKFFLLSEQVLSILFKLSMEGNVKACKIFLDAIGESNQHIRANQYIDKQQNNFNSEPKTITGMNIIDSHSSSQLPLAERLQMLNLTEKDLEDFLKSQ